MIELSNRFMGRLFLANRSHQNLSCVQAFSNYPSFKMASSKAVEVPKLFAITLIRSGIRQPYWEKRTLKALGLTKLHKTVVHKNTPSVNGQLNSVKHLISITPIYMKSKSEVLDGNGSIASQYDTAVFLKRNGEFDMDKYLKYCERQQKDESH